jgi:isopentenyldiphosphate isomerase
MELRQVIVIFADIRGFTKWSEKTKAFLYVEELISKFYEVSRTSFPNTYQKRLGDGLMIVEEIPDKPTLEKSKEQLNKYLEKIFEITKYFEKICLDFGKDYGLKTELKLGWGIVRGTIKKIQDDGETDYLGADVNRAARLCSIARPYGIVIDRENFSEIPEPFSSEFYEETRKLEGIIDEVEVYVTQDIKEQFVPREGKKENPEVHVAGTCFKKEGKNIYILLAKRNFNRRLYPNLYEGGGGQLARNEDFTDGVRRHYLQEMGIEIDVKEDFHLFYKIDTNNEPLIPGIRFLCEYKRGEPLSKNHSEITWVSEAQFEEMDSSWFPPNFKQQTHELLERYKTQT